MENIKEICNECGRSVSYGSDLFVDRIPSFDNTKTHKEMGKPYPKGSYICRECESEINAEINAEKFNIGDKVKAKWFPDTNFYIGTVKKDDQGLYIDVAEGIVGYLIDAFSIEKLKKIDIDKIYTLCEDCMGRINGYNCEVIGYIDSRLD